MPLVHASSGLATRSSPSISVAFGAMQDSGQGGTAPGSSRGLGPGPGSIKPLHSLGSVHLPPPPSGMGFARPALADHTNIYRTPQSLPRPATAPAKPDMLMWSPPHHQNAPQMAGGIETPTRRDDRVKSPGPAFSQSTELPGLVDDGRKPSYSYAALIAMAIMQSPGQKLTLAQIYQWISDTFSWYRRAAPTWHNSIRHNLSLNKAFVKQLRPKEDPGKGNYWVIARGHEGAVLGSHKPKRDSSMLPQLQEMPQAPPPKRRALQRRPSSTPTGSMGPLATPLATMSNPATAPTPTSAPAQSTNNTTPQLIAPQLVTSYAADRAEGSLERPMERSSDAHSTDDELLASSSPGHEDEARKPALMDGAPHWSPTERTPATGGLLAPPRLGTGDGAPGSAGSPGLSLRIHRAAVHRMTTLELSPMSGSPQTPAPLPVFRFDDGFGSPDRRRTPDRSHDHRTPDHRTPGFRSAPQRLIFTAASVDEDGPLALEASPRVVLTPIRRPFDMPIPDQTHTFSPFRPGDFAGSPGR